MRDGGEIRDIQSLLLFIKLKLKKMRLFQKNVLKSVELFFTLVDESFFCLNYFLKN